MAVVWNVRGKIGFVCVTAALSLMSGVSEVNAGWRWNASGGSVEIAVQTVALGHSAPSGVPGGESGLAAASNAGWLYAAAAAGQPAPVVLPTDRRYPHAVRGGSWDDDPPALRCAARYQSSPSWSRARARGFR